MKIFKKTIYTLLAGAAIAGTTAGCSDFLEEHSQDLAKVESWTDLDEVLIGDAYMKTGRIFIANSATNMDRDADFDFLHLMTDEIEFTEDVDIDYVSYRSDCFAYITWQADCGVDYQDRYTAKDNQNWNDLYNRINICNMVLALIDEQPEKVLDDAVQKRRIKGEAHFLRGYYYFILTNLYCEPYVPVEAESMMGMPIKTTEFVEDVDFRRENLADTYKFIISELNEAAGCLEDITRKSVFRADINSVNLLLSRVYLYMQDWNNAAVYAQKVLDNKSELLDLRTVAEGENSVSAKSPETIFSTGDYMVAVTFADTRYYRPQCIVSEYIQKLYKNNDIRGSRYIGVSQYRKTPNVFMKYNGQNEKWGTSYMDYGSCFSMRTPEAYLNLAEAQAYAGEEGKARETLEKFLPFRMTGNISVKETGNDLIDFIREERAREFLLEGHRWFDLRRYTVCEPYKWSKEIIHAYPILDDHYFDHFDYYKLEEYDQAYTLAVPRSILSFQVSLGSHVRPARYPIASGTGDDY